MNWLTIKQIIEASKTNDYEAIKCSRIHWEQLRDATRKELQDGITCTVSTRKVFVDGVFCALCYRYDGCNKRGCPIEKEVGTCVPGKRNPWLHAASAVYNKTYNGISDSDPIQRMIDLLLELEEKEEKIIGKAICLWCNGEGETEESLGMHSDYFSCKHCKGTGMGTINDKKKESK